MVVPARRHGVNQRLWAWAPLQAALTHLIPGRLRPEAVPIVTEASFPKKGTRSVGVARRYCGALGKTANCQVAVSVHFGTETTSLPLTWRRYTPEKWIDDPARRVEARVPEDARYATRNTVAREALDAVLAWGVGPRVVLTDTSYRRSCDFRAALAARGPSCCAQTAPGVKGRVTASPAAMSYRRQGRPATRPLAGQIPAIRRQHQTLLIRWDARCPTFRRA